MNAIALAAVLAAALLHALWNVAAKHARRGEGDAVAFQALTAGAVVLLWAPAALWWGWAELPHWPWQAWAIVAASGAVHLMYFSSLLTGYRVADLTVVYPMARGSGPLWTTIAAVLLLGERPSGWGWAGLATIVLGMALLTGLLRRRPLTAPVRAGLRWGALTGALIASYTVIDAYAVKVLLLSPLLVE